MNCFSDVEFQALNELYDAEVAYQNHLLVAILMAVAGLISIFVKYEAMALPFVSSGSDSYEIAASKASQTAPEKA